MALLTSVLKDDIDFHAKYWKIKQYYCIKYYTSLLDQYQTKLLFKENPGKHIACLNGVVCNSTLETMEKTQNDP